MIGWHTPGIWKAPLLWSLYISLVFIDLGFLLFVFTAFEAATRSLVTHGFALGGTGLITLSMMSRVTLRHTGRNVQSPPSALTPAIALLIAAALVRVFLPLMDMSHYIQWIALSQVLWIAAFSVFVFTCFAMLSGPRVDGQPG